ncbi:MAG: ABC transporter ATP-binding protein [Phycisphaerae bacterium]
MTDGAEPLLSAEDLSFGFPGRPDFFRSIRSEMRPGECWGIIGPNGAGKSTLLRLLAGLLKPEAGVVRIRGKPLDGIPRMQRARETAFLPQHLAHDLPTCARDIVLMGRHPYRRFGLFESGEDRAVADRVMRATRTLAFSDRALSTLSGGEAQRVHIAAALAQEPAVLLLDEPTAGLDLHYQLTILEILRRLTEEDRLLVVVVTHDINLAARYCTHLLLLHEGRVVQSGQPEDVVRPEVLERVYAVRLTSMARPEAEAPWVLPLSPLPAQADDGGVPRPTGREEGGG